LLNAVLPPAKKAASVHAAASARTATSPHPTAAGSPTPAKPSPTRAATTKPAPPPPPTPATPRDSELCRVDDAGASFYLSVTSATEHDFRACANATVIPGTLDDLFSLPGVDRRCVLGIQAIAELHALVGVYSDTKAEDLAAARDYCRAYGGTN
jgi:hypothetical protein